MILRGECKIIDRNIPTELDMYMLGKRIVFLNNSFQFTAYSKNQYLGGKWGQKFLLYTTSLEF